MISLRSLGIAVVCALWSSTALAQAPSQQAGSDSSEATRPATSTFSGDTGLWYVPTAEVLPQGGWSAGLYRAGFNYVEGFSNVSDFAATFAYGVYRKMELFGSFKVDTRIDRDLRPIFIANPEVGGVISAYPNVRQGWSGNNIGDFLVGVKFNLLSEEYQKPVAVALRASVKLPTGDEDAGVSTGKLDANVDLVLSKNAMERVELAGYGGFAVRGKTDATTQTNAFRWGVGAGFPSNSPLRLTTELHGELPFDDVMTVSSPIIANDLSRAPSTSVLHGFTASTVGVTWQHRDGFFVGGGLSWTFPTENRDAFNTDSPKVGTIGDFVA